MNIRDYLKNQFTTSAILKENPQLDDPDSPDFDPLFCMDWQIACLYVHEIDSNILIADEYGEFACDNGKVIVHRSNANTLWDTFELLMKTVRSELGINLSGHKMRTYGTEEDSVYWEIDEMVKKIQDSQVYIEKP